MTNNLVWVTNLKAIGILAVILGHIASPFGAFIYSWHMPLFFVIAGFFIDDNINFKKNFKRLMLPYLLFCFIGILIEIMKRDFLSREQLNIFDSFKGGLFYMDYSHLLGHYGHVLWFLPTLFFSKLIFSYILKKTNNSYLILLLCTLFFLISFYIELPFALDNSLNVLIWICIGYIIYKNIHTRVLFGVSFIGLILISLIFGIPTLDIANKNYDNYLLNILWSSSLVIVLAYFFINTDLKKYQKYLTYLGISSLLIYLIHPYTNNIAHIIVRYIIDINSFDDSLSSLWYLKFFISISLCLIFINLYQKIIGAYN